MITRADWKRWNNPDALFFRETGFISPHLPVSTELCRDVQRRNTNAECRVEAWNQFCFRHEPK